MKLSKFAAELQNKGFDINFEALPEDCSPNGQFSEDEDIKWVLSELENGNDAAWFCAKVSLSFSVLKSFDEYLGCCSYRSFDEFTGTDNDYFDDMLMACLSDIQEKASKIKDSFPVIQ